MQFIYAFALLILSVAAFREEGATRFEPSGSVGSNRESVEELSLRAKLLSEDNLLSTWIAKGKMPRNSKQHSRLARWSGYNYPYGYYNPYSYYNSYGCWPYYTYYTYC
ncbi:hypothetical protein TELCIR_21513 [Teladorsagia circumcincta]|uniref:Uncharacterized protein n=1 Tax=Teladorsagia circumcincta TaxID=45464 RepID=A0A2G9TGH8_TELCI|nr:hypothetical protein TELCIR_21513 [Teladorsagia circumcincta]